MFGLEAADGLGVLEAFGQRIDQDRVQPVDAGAVVAQQGRGTGDGIGRGVHHFFPNIPDRPPGSPALPS